MWYPEIIVVYWPDEDNNYAFSDGNDDAAVDSAKMKAIIEIMIILITANPPKIYTVHSFYYS